MDSNVSADLRQAEEKWTHHGANRVVTAQTPRTIYKRFIVLFVVTKPAQRALQKFGVVRARQNLRTSLGLVALLTPHTLIRTFPHRYIAFNLGSGCTKRPFTIVVCRIQFKALHTYIFSG